MNDKTCIAKPGEHWPILMAPTKAVGEYEVGSRTDYRLTHIVRLQSDGDRCSCIGFRKHFGPCVHVRACRARGFAQLSVTPEPVRQLSTATRGLY